MNILLIGTPHEIAKGLDDKRLFAQYKECLQMLATAMAVASPETFIKLRNAKGTQFLTSHENHPVTQWVKTRAGAVFFTAQVMTHCLTEHARRFDNPFSHYESYPVFSTLQDWAIETDTEVTEPKTYPLCIPEHLREAVFGYKADNGDTLPRETANWQKAVIAYRFYCCADKLNPIADVWTKAEPPIWLLDRSQIKVLA
jgi:hypothetical protein